MWQDGPYRLETGMSFFSFLEKMALCPNLDVMQKKKPEVAKSFKFRPGQIIK